MNGPYPEPGNLVQTFLSYFFKIYFNIILLSMAKYS
jgi:hypothetical protein